MRNNPLQRLRFNVTHWPTFSKFTATFHPMTGAKELVVGASGFVGSHVTRQLVARGDAVRVLIRRTSSTKAIDDLDVEYHYGDIFDDDALRAAMAGVEDVFYCVVDTRAWLCDPARTSARGSRRRRAERELGWQPKPIHNSIRRAATFFRDNRGHTPS